MIEMLQYTFMQHALVVGVVLGLVIPLVGVIIVLKRLSMIGDALSHTSLAGVAAGLIAGINPVLGAAFACLVGAFCIEGIRLKFREQSELAVAVVMATGIGFAGVLSGFVPNAASFSSFLFGSILTVSDLEVLAVLVVAASAAAFCLVLYRELFLMAFDERHARAAGVRNGMINALFVVIIALMVAVAARTVGSLIVSSMMVVPVACALQVARSWRQMYAVSALVGVSTTVAGIVVSYFFGLKPGGTIVLMAVALLLVILLVKAVLSRVRPVAGKDALPDRAA
ncbi:MAG: metal ABC transporter permease [Berryella intestinalis]|uniref:metal ABC transporter permease n=1 Tax=Berryella intestinalis TaxID=1531429 RepID=UPI002A5622D0|nr:metal ABC transporter permease [Berryella intestinalis]MDD7368848.1 metal ABC transporter permease [Berryella intestinalis]MDY3129354.1 metal ABC transporter permease [Berryella intestinalis]